MDRIETFYAEVSAKIDDKLNRLVPDGDVEPKRLHEAVRWSLFGGGKRFRPALVIAAGRTFGAADEKLIGTAAAIEMIHTYSLIHDDLPSMDDDNLRRGRQTCHKKFGEATAILAGDVLQTLAFKTIADDENLSADTRIHLINEIASGAGTPDGMVAGQQMDLDAEGESAAAIDGIERIHARKTGALITAAAKSGAIIGNANAADMGAISSYALKLGLLFQVTDDIIDITQTSETLGKTAGKDAAVKKATYPNFYGVDKAMGIARGVHSALVADLESIKKRADLLREIADQILDRRN